MNNPRCRVCGSTDCGLPGLTERTADCELDCGCAACRAEEAQVRVCAEHAVDWYAEAERLRAALTRALRPLPAGHCRICRRADCQRIALEEHADYCDDPDCADCKRAETVRMDCYRIADQD